MFFYFSFISKSVAQFSCNHFKNLRALLTQDLNAVAEVPKEPEDCQTIPAVGNAAVSCDTAANIIIPTATSTEMAEDIGAAHPSTDLGDAASNLDEPILISSAKRIKFEEAKIFLPEG